MRTMILLSGIFLSQTIFAKTVYYANSAINLTIPFVDTDGDLISEPTVFVFPNEVRTINNKSKFIVRPEGGQDPDYTRLHIIPMLKRGRDLISFTMVDGHTIKINARIVRKKEMFDSEVKFMPASVLENRSKKDGKFRDIDIMRALLSSKKILGMTEKKVNKKVYCGTRMVSANLLKVYESSKSKAFVIKIKNKSTRNAYKLDESKMYFAKRDLSRSPIYHLSNEVLEPKGKGKSSSILTIVIDSGVKISNGKLCKLGEQLHKVKVSKGVNHEN